MMRDVSPILDRHTQEDIGRKLRERLDDDCGRDPSSEIERLLASLREQDERRDRRPEARN